ncbi:MAG: phosphopentomutase [Acidimicrobiia bacterium]|nr:phosphopentomutase [Acidimicrobiia bacterium]
MEKRTTIDRAIVIVMDSCGAGEAPDAAEYGDAGSDTLGHTAEAVGGFDLPNFAAAGLGNLHGSLAGMPPVERPGMAFGRLAEASAAKDSTTGHWELAGLVTTRPFATFTDTGFPAELIAAVEHEAKVTFIGNRAASGTVIIEELGAEHLRTGRPILYTSADSVFQIATHTDVLSVPELYDLCEIARRHCNEYRIGRIIARPFEGGLGSFKRTYDRKDFAMPPPGPTLLDLARDAGLEVHGIGKIEDLFAGHGLTSAQHTEGDADGLARTVAAMDRMERGVIMTNLVDLDMVYGHRENPAGYYEGLRLIDSRLPGLIAALRPRDLLVFAADHGNDPTDGSTDHTREYVPLLVAGLHAAGVGLGDRETYADVAATLSEGLGLEPPAAGTSFLADITRTTS